MNNHKLKMALLSGLVRRLQNNQENWVDHDDLAETLAWLSENTTLEVGELVQIGPLKTFACRLQEEEEPLIEVALRKTSNNVTARYKLTNRGHWYWRTNGGRNLNFREIDQSILRLLVENQEEMPGQTLLKEIRIEFPDVNWETLVRRVHLLTTASPPLCQWDPLQGDGRILDFVCNVTYTGELTLSESEAKKGLSMGEPDINSKQVFVIHGRNEKARQALFGWLRSLHLEPLEWDHAVQLTGKASPTTLEVIESGLSSACAVIALMTDDEEVRLREELDPKQESRPGYQPRPNVLFEAGLACAKGGRDRTIFVELGTLRAFSDIDGLNTIRLGDQPSVKKLQSLKNRLTLAGCSLNDTGSDWLETKPFLEAIITPKLEGLDGNSSGPIQIECEHACLVPLESGFQMEAWCVFSNSGSITTEIQNFRAYLDDGETAGPSYIGDNFDAPNYHPHAEYLRLSPQQTLPPGSMRRWVLSLFIQNPTPKLKKAKAGESFTFKKPVFIEVHPVVCSPIKLSFETFTVSTHRGLACYRS